MKFLIRKYLQWKLNSGCWGGRGGADSENEDDVGRGFRELYHQSQNVLYLEKDLGYTGVCISQNLPDDLYNSLYIFYNKREKTVLQSPR